MATADGLRFVDRRFPTYVDIIKDSLRLKPSPGSVHRDGETFELRIFLDGCMLEVFANGRQALCQQIWPTRDDSLDIRFLARDEDARINTLKAWEMKAACQIDAWMTGKEPGGNENGQR